MFESIKNFFKNLFSPAPADNSASATAQNPFGTGALRNVPDTRDIHIAAVQAPVVIPPSYKTDLSMFSIQNQLQLGTCVGQWLRLSAQYYWYKIGNINPTFSARSVEARIKLVDGLPNDQGTTPTAGAKVLTTDGIATNLVVTDNNTLPWAQYIAPLDAATVAGMAQYKLPGYVFVPVDQISIQQAIYQNGIVGMTASIDSNWFVGIIKKVISSIGNHRFTAFGYDADGFFCQNSWGVGWVAQFLNKAFPLGDFYFLWSDYSSDVFDVIAFPLTEIPAPVLDNAKSLDYVFSNVPIKQGQTGAVVLQLQNRLDKEGFWPVGIAKTGYYGPVTAAAVLRYQLKNNVDTVANLQLLDGRQVGPKTIAILNGHVGLDLAHAIIAVESGGNDYAIGDLGIDDAHGGHAYGPMQIREGVVDDANKVLNTTHTSKDCLGNRDLSIAIFNAYWIAHPALITDEDKAKAWNGGAGWKSLYGKPGYESYSAKIDAYWASVKAKMS